jgi:hypothetical protein
MSYCNLTISFDRMAAFELAPVSRDWLLLGRFVAWLALELSMESSKASLTRLIQSNALRERGRNISMFRLAFCACSYAGQEVQIADAMAQFSYP